MMSNLFAPFFLPFVLEMTLTHSNLEAVIKPKKKRKADDILRLIFSASKRQ